MRDGERPPAAAAQSIPDTLRDIQSITDAALSRLGPQELLEVLVERVKEALEADTAAVLLLDRPSGHLVATAASGLEEEVRQGVHIPIGHGFAGRIAELGRPVVLDEVDHTTVINPILLQRGIRSLMGAPLLAGGAVIGVLHVGTLSGRRFGRRDVDLLQVAADRAALAVLALDARLDREAASALQRSLVPSALPALPGLDLAARYVPGRGDVGGDWYDVFPLPSGTVCAVIGDVTGTGLKAAVIMGRMRSALRAYTLETEDPADVLGRLDRKMRHFEPDAMATIVCAMISPGRDEVRVCNAGHLPLLMAAPGQAARPAAVPPDVLIGAATRTPRRVTTLPLPPGGLLCLYTDGLVEQRGRPIDEGITRICGALRATDPETACITVMGAMSEYSPHTDDIALLMLRRAAPEEGAADRGAGVRAALDGGAAAGRAGPGRPEAAR
jgi:putative methionine-R-sulfoxide reductase with GAF domain